MNNEQKQLLKYFLAQTKEFRKYSKKVRKKSSVKAVHKLRLSIRRMRLVFWLLKRSHETIPVKKLDRKLNKLGEALGKVRELQIAKKDAKKYKLKILKVKRESKKSVLELKKKMAKSNIQKIEKLNSRFFKYFSEEDFDLGQGVAALSVNADNWYYQKKIKPQSIHQLRKDLKKLHYFLMANNIKNLKLEGLLNIIGKVHDLDVLQGLSQMKSKPLEQDKKNMEDQIQKLVAPAIRSAKSDLDRITKY